MVHKNKPPLPNIDHLDPLVSHPIKSPIKNSIQSYPPIHYHQRSTTLNSQYVYSISVIDNASRRWFSLLTVWTKHFHYYYYWIIIMYIDMLKMCKNRAYDHSINMYQQQYSSQTMCSSTRGHSRILINGVRNTHGTGLIVGSDGNCKARRYQPVFFLFHTVM